MNDNKISKNMAPTLISDFRNEYNKKVNNLLKAQGVNDIESSYGGIIFFLLEHESLTMQQLAKLINRDKSTLTVLVKKLIQRGYANTKTCEADRRVKYITLTDKAKNLKSVFIDVSKQTNKQIWQNISEEEASQFITTLLKMKENIKGE